MLPWLKAIPGALKLVPREVWYVLAAAILFAIAMHWHAGKVRAHDTALIVARDAQWQQRLDQEHVKALAAERKSEKQGAAIAQLNKEKNNAQVRDNARLADALSVRGPGKAAASSCGQGYHSATPAVAGGRNETAPVADATGPQVPSGDWAVVPWDWLVKRAQEHDDLLSVEQTRRTDDAQQRAAWEKMRVQKP